MFAGLALRLLQPLVAIGIEAAEPVFEPEPFAARAEAFKALRMAGLEPHTDIDLLILIDYDRPSYERRLHVYERGKCPVRSCLVSHGRGSGCANRLFSASFSNSPGSLATSLGLFRIEGDRPSTKFGRSIEMTGLQPGLNHLAMERMIVIHPAWYVSYDIICQNIDEENCPRLGESKGCPALTDDDFAFVLRSIRNVHNVGGRVFLYAYSGRNGSGEYLKLASASEVSPSPAGQQ